MQRPLVQGHKDGVARLHLWQAPRGLQIIHDGRPHPWRQLRGSPSRHPKCRTPACRSAGNPPSAAGRPRRCAGRSPGRSAGGRNGAGLAPYRGGWPPAAPDLAGLQVSGTAVAGHFRSFQRLGWIVRAERMAAAAAVLDEVLSRWRNGRRRRCRRGTGRPSPVNAWGGCRRAGTAHGGDGSSSPPTSAAAECRCPAVAGPQRSAAAPGRGRRPAACPRRPACPATGGKRGSIQAGQNKGPLPPPRSWPAARPVVGTGGSAAGSVMGTSSATVPLAQARLSWLIHQNIVYFRHPAQQPGPGKRQTGTGKGKRPAGSATPTQGCVQVASTSLELMFVF